MRKAYTDNAGIILQKGIREALAGAVDLILPYRCALCGNVSDTEDRFSGYDRLYEGLYGKEPDLHVCGRCLSDLNILDEEKRWSLCLTNPVANDVCPGLGLYSLGRAPPTPTPDPQPCWDPASG